VLFGTALREALYTCEAMSDTPSEEHATMSFALPAYSGPTRSAGTASARAVRAATTSTADTANLKNLCTVTSPE
jgi:hypothetical protein